MYQKVVPLDDSESLLMEWGEHWSGLTIHFKGRLIGSFPDKEDLKIGRRFMLPDGQPIMVLLRETDLEVWYQGRDIVSGTESGKVALFSRAVNILILVGLIQLLIMPVVSGQVTRMIELRVASGLILAGLLIGLSIWSKRTGNKAPFWVGIGFCILDLLLLYTLCGISGLKSIAQLRIVIIITSIMSSLIVVLYQGIQSKPPALTYRRDLGHDAPLDSEV